MPEKIKEIKDDEAKEVIQQTEKAEKPLQLKIKQNNNIIYFKIYKKIKVVYEKNNLCSTYDGLHR